MTHANGQPAATLRTAVMVYPFAADLLGRPARAGARLARSYQRVRLRIWPNSGSSQPASSDRTRELASKPAKAGRAGLPRDP